MKTCTKLLLLLAVFFITINATGSNLPQQESKSRVTSEYKTTAKALLDATDFEKTIGENLTSTFAQFGLEGQIVNNIVNELVEEMPEKMVDIYSKYFTLDDLKQLIEINKTEIQTKLRSLLPQINEEMMQEGQCFASGKKSPSADIVVTKDFEEAMREYLDAYGFEKQIGQIYSIIENNYSLPSGSLGGLSDQMPDIMTRIYSKYLTTSEIKQATALAKTPCLKKFNEKTPDITKETLEVTQQIIMDYFKNHS